MRRSVFGLILVLALASNHGEAQDKRPRAPTLQDLAKVWVGDAGPSSLEYFRLAINPDGSGVLTVQYVPKRTPIAYKVDRTTLAAYKVSFELTPLDSSSQLLALSGTALSSGLTLEASDPKGTWKRQIWLQPYSDLRDRLQAVTVVGERIERSPTR